jgi:glycosyltransferase involved in cell wall biosynthesis
MYRMHVSKPVISFIVPSRGAGVYLEHTINNLLDTSDSRYEVVLCLNNGSQHVPKSILNLFDSRLRVFRTTKNLSMSSNWYQGLLNAKGEWVCYVGSDDGIVSKNLSKFIDLLIKQPNISVVTNHTLAFAYPRSKSNSWASLPIVKCTDRQIRVNWPIKMASFFPQFNYDLPQPYSKAIVRKVILQKIIEKETEIPTSAPDVFLGNYIAMLSKNGIFIDVPLTIRGSSEVSNGIQNGSGDPKTLTSKEWLREFHRREGYLLAKFGPTCRPALARDSYLSAKAYRSGTQRKKHLYISEFWCNLSCRDKSHHKNIWNYFSHVTLLVYYFGLSLRKLWYVKNFGTKIPKDKRITIYSKTSVFDISKFFD